MTLTPLAGLGPELTSDQRERYARQIRLPGFGEEGQRRLLCGKVLVVGAGGLGSPALLYLAAAGVGTIGIIDDDVVDLTNLQRQVIHSTANVGIPKTVSAARAVRALNPDVQVIEHACRITENNAEEIISGYDVVLDGTDNFLTRYTVDAACSRLSVPEIWGSILRHAAQVSVSVALRAWPRMRLIAYWPIARVSCTFTRRGSSSGCHSGAQAGSGGRSPDGPLPG